TSLPTRRSSDLCCPSHVQVGKCFEHRTGLIAENPSAAVNINYGRNVRRRVVRIDHVQFVLVAVLGSVHHVGFYPILIARVFCEVGGVLPEHWDEKEYDEQNCPAYFHFVFADTALRLESLP